MIRRATTRILLMGCILCLGSGLAVGQQSGEIDWNKAKQLHQKVTKGEKLTDEERAYYDRARQLFRPGAAKQSGGDIDWSKAQQLRQKIRKGEKLTDEEQAYLQRAQRARQTGARSQAGTTSEPTKPSVGLKPLTDMTGEDRYKGQDGGLYGGGKNQPPEQHLQAAIQQAKLIQPLTGDGKPAADGKIGFISVGMSNTTQEFSQFIPLGNAEPAKSPQVVIVDGAVGGMDTKAWVEGGKTTRRGSKTPWDVLRKRLEDSGITAQQVQVAWIKQAMARPQPLGDFPKHAEAMKEQMVVLLNMLKERFPNLRIAYLSNRTYAGYAKTELNPEPYAYETAFVVRWLIQDQIKGSPALNYHPEKGAVKSPLLLWGPYLWTAGESGRKIDGLVWKLEDTGPDGTHPSTSGRQKVAQLLLNFLKTDPTAKVWFTKGGR